MARYGPPIHATFINVGDHPTSEALARASEARAIRTDINSVAPITQVVVDDFTSRECDAVFLAYTDYHSVLKQTPVVRQLLPIQPGEPRRRWRRITFLNRMRKPC